MLFVETNFERSLFFCVEREQIVILIRATVEHAAAAMHGGIERGGVDSTVFRLHVKDGAIECDVGVMTEKHSLAHPNLTVADTYCRLFSEAALTERGLLSIITLRP